MGPIALLLCVVVTFVLFRIERKSSPRTSLALWVPTVWVLIAGSRPVGRWLVTTGSMDADPTAGSMPDRLALASLIALGILIVVSRRNIPWSEVLRKNAWLFIFFFFMGLSVLWVGDPFVSFKRWIRSAGVVVMGLVILTEAEPRQALAAVFRRCAYGLIPVSLVLIKYFPNYGRDYGRWNGIEMWTGVATHKNGLGQLCALSIFFLVWSLFRGSRHEDGAAKSRTYADFFVLALALFLLCGPGAGAFSATAISVSVVSVGMFFALRRRVGFARLIAAHLLLLTIVVVAVYPFLSDMLTVAVTSMLERDPNLTGRATDIWPVVMQAAASHPILGAGYGGVWGLGGDLSQAVGVEQAHNGYLDVYLQLGMVGVVLLAAFLLEFCARIRGVFAVDFDWGLFGLGFLALTLLYNMSETNFFDVYAGTALVLLTVVFTAKAAPASLARAAAPLPEGPAVRATVRRTRSRRPLGPNAPIPPAGVVTPIRPRIPARRSLPVKH